jgi:voltage-gated potassium channel
MRRKKQTSPLAEIYTALTMVLFTLAIGVCGYTLIEHYTFVEAIYMTVITLATVGFQEVRPLSDAGRVFTTVMILANLGIFAYVITRISRYFMDGEFARYYKMYRMHNKIDKVEGHTIICGYGRNGQESAMALRRNKETFVVIEQQEKLFSDASDAGLLHIVADATKDYVLLEAGIERAKALISALPEDTLNVFVVLTARSLNPDIKIISRASDITSVKKLKSAGANNVIMPDKIGGAHMAMLVTNPDIEEFVDLMSTKTSDAFQINEIVVQQSIRLDDLDSWRTTGATLLGYKDDTQNYHLNPSPDTVIAPGHRLIAMGSKEQISKLKATINKQ